MKTSKLVKRLYRILPEHDKLVKKNKKKFGSESAVIRNRIETLKVLTPFHQEYKRNTIPYPVDKSS